MIVHLLEYRVKPGHEAEVVALLRHRWPPTTRPEGLVAEHSGRRLSGHGRKHLEVTAWQDESTFLGGTNSEGLPGFLARGSSLLGDRAPRQYRVIASTGLGREGAQVLRVYRTSIASGEVGLWEQRTLENVYRVATLDGHVWTIAGVEIEAAEEVETAAPTGQVCVVVLTAWKEWNLLLAATGGRLNRALVDTELTDLEQPATADHFELLEAESGPE